MGTGLGMKVERGCRLWWDGIGNWGGDGGKDEGRGMCTWMGAGTGTGMGVEARVGETGIGQGQGRR